MNIDDQNIKLPQWSQHPMTLTSNTTQVKAKVVLSTFSITGADTKKDKVF